MEETRKTAADVAEGHATRLRLRSTGWAEIKRLARALQEARLRCVLHVLGEDADSGIRGVIVETLAGDEEWPLRRLVEACGEAGLRDLARTAQAPTPPDLVAAKLAMTLDLRGEPAWSEGDARASSQLGWTLDGSGYVWRVRTTVMALGDAVDATADVELGASKGMALSVKAAALMGKAVWPFALPDGTEHVAREVAWTGAREAKAASEGWALRERPWGREIAVIGGGPGRAKTDAQALALVAAEADKRSPLHVVALTLHERAVGARR